MSKMATSPPNRPFSFFVKLKRGFRVNYSLDPLIERRQAIFTPRTDAKFMLLNISCENSLF